MVNKNLAEFTHYAKSVGETTHELTNGCVDKQRALDSRVATIERMLDQVVDE